MKDLIMSNIKFEIVDFVFLKPHKKSLKVHSKEKIKLLANSISALDCIVPIVVDKNYRIIAGNARYKAIKQLGLKSVPVIKAEHLTDDQVRLYRIADNKLAEGSKWDDELLRVELEYLSNIDIDVTLTGFQIPEIDFILNDQAFVEPVTDEALLAPPTRPVTRSRDIFSLGKHRVACGDLRIRPVMLSLMGQERATLVITDPPFNVPINGHVLVGSSRHSEFAMASGEMSQEEFTAFLQSCFEQFCDFSVDGSLHLVFMDWRHIREITQAGDAVYDKQMNLCVWAKSNAGMGSLWRSQHELVFIFKKGKKPHINNVHLGKHGRHRSNVWQYAGMNAFGANRDEALESHPTVKPETMIADAIMDVSNRGDIVLDGFLGSGTTLLAAEQTGRVCYGCEIEPRYVDVAIHRFHQMSDAPVIHEQSGMTFDELRVTRLDADTGEVGHES